MIIYHIGLPKCGSSSIQDYFYKYKSYYNNSLIFNNIKINDLYSITYELSSTQAKNQLLNILKLINLEVENLNFPHAIDTINQLTNKQIKNGKNIVHSSEALFSNLEALSYLVHLFPKEETKIVAYIRKRSSFLMSHFNEFQFRNFDVMNKIATYSDEMHLPSNLLKPLEKYLIVLILSDFKCFIDQKAVNLSKYFLKLEQEVKDTNTKILVNTLPSKTNTYNLIADFYNVLESKKIFKEDISLERTNNQFDYVLVNTIGNATEDGNNVLRITQSNKFLHYLSNILENRRGRLSNFELKLLDYIDSFFLNDNQELIKKYGLIESELTPSRYISKSEIVQIIEEELEYRRQNKDLVIEELRQFNADLIKLLFSDKLQRRFKEYKGVKWAIRNLKDEIIHKLKSKS